MRLRLLRRPSLSLPLSPLCISTVQRRSAVLHVLHDRNPPIQQRKAPTTSTSCRDTSLARF